MDAAEQLLAIEEIKQLKARYFRCMDTKDWDGFASVFAPDAVLDVTGETGTPTKGIVRGNELIAEYVRGHVDPVTTVHHGHMPEIEITSPTDGHRHLVDGRHAPLAGRVTDRVRCTATATTTRPTRRSTVSGGSPAASSPACASTRDVAPSTRNLRQLVGLYPVC